MCAVMNKGAYCYICSVWYTLIIVWMAEGREAGVVMTGVLSWQLSLPQWKRLESTVKNASEIYRPALGLCIRGGETWMVPSGRGPSLWLHGEITEEYNRGTMQRQRRPCFLFLSVSAGAHLSSMVSWTIKCLTVTFNLTQQGDTKSFPADACWSVAFRYSSHCSYTPMRYVMALTLFDTLIFVLFSSV